MKTFKKFIMEHPYINPLMSDKSSISATFNKYQDHSEWKKTTGVSNVKPNLKLFKDMKVGLKVFDSSMLKTNKLINSKELPQGVIISINWGKSLTIKWDNNKKEVIKYDENDKRANEILVY